MQKIIRFLASGIIAGIAAVTVIDLEEKQIIPPDLGSTLEGLFKFLYEYKELIVFAVVFGLMFITFGALIAKILAPKVERALIKHSMNGKPAWSTSIKWKIRNHQRTMGNFLISWVRLYRGIYCSYKERRDEGMVYKERFKYFSKRT